MHRQAIEDRGRETVDRRQFDDMLGEVAQFGDPRRVRQQDQLAAAGDHLAGVAGGFIEQTIRRGDQHHRHTVVDQRDRPMFHFAGGIALGMEIAELLQLQRAFQSDRITSAAAEIEDVAGLRQAVGDRVIARQLAQHTANQIRQFAERAQMGGGDASVQAAARQRPIHRQHRQRH